MRETGNSATWTFNTQQLANAKANSVYLNITPLVTNGTNGGSGYGGVIHLQVQGTKTVQRTTVLTNPFRPTDPANSSGIGYQVYGNPVKIPQSVLKDATSIKVTLTFKPTYKFHVAVNQGCLSIGYGARKHGHPSIKKSG